MIKHISILNFAIIENIEVDFFRGFSPITGETGAGKSIIIEAISMALGSRADKTFVRTGATKATIQILGEVAGEEFILYREIGADGRSLCKVNGEIVSLSQQSIFAKKVADIHGQYAHQSLLDPECHINLIDSYQKDVIYPAKEAVLFAFEDYVKKYKSLENLLSSKETGEKEREYMAYQLEEIQTIDPKPLEDISLEDDIKTLSNREKIFSSLDSAYNFAYTNGESAQSQLISLNKSLSDISDFFEPAKGLSQEIMDVYYRLEDISENIRAFRDGIDMEGNPIDYLVERLDSIKQLKSKHGGTLDSVFAFVEKAKLSLVSFEDKEELILRLTLEKEQAENLLKEKTLALTASRKSSASELEIKITEELKDLNFQDGSIKIEFHSKPAYTSDGLDKVQFLIKTNKGDEHKPLSKIASGGEISRVMLAFKKISCEYDHIPTIIFDEVDNGISGQTASIVGRKLLEIGKSRQVIVITHLPQVAAYGDNNYSIEKKESDVSTYTTVRLLSEEEKTHEIARLLSGENVTPSSIENAKELINCK